jgi:hypothetical protein
MAVESINGLLLQFKHSLLWNISGWRIDNAECSMSTLLVSFLIAGVFREAREKQHAVCGRSTRVYNRTRCNNLKLNIKRRSNYVRS